MSNHGTRKNRITETIMIECQTTTITITTITIAVEEEEEIIGEADMDHVEAEEEMIVGEMNLLREEIIATMITAMGHLVITTIAARHLVTITVVHHGIINDALDQ